MSSANSPAAAFLYRVVHYRGAVVPFGVRRLVLAEHPQRMVYVRRLVVDVLGHVEPPGVHRPTCATSITPGQLQEGRSRPIWTML